MRADYNAASRGFPFVAIQWCDLVGGQPDLSSIQDGECSECISQGLRARLEALKKNHRIWRKGGQVLSFLDQAELATTNGLDDRFWKVALGFYLRSQ